MDKRTIYFDHGATTPLNREVLEAMMPYFTERYGNASSIYKIARDSKIAVDNARDSVAAAIGANSGEIYFTSGGTEADNWAIKGVAYANRKKGRHIITSSIEHHAVLNTCEYLEREGYEVTYLPVDNEGLVSIDSVRDAIREDTILISIILANNEIGTIQPIAEIGSLAKERGILFHTDAVQAVGNIHVDVEKLGIDLLSMSAHKFYGPMGIGALYVKKGTRISPILHGGAQESGKRASTENVPAIVGMGKAIELATKNIDEYSKKITELRDMAIDEILKGIPYSRLNGHRDKRLPGNANFSFEFIEGESLLLLLDMEGIAASSGSACTSGSLDPSHVLLGIGLPHEIAHGSLRLTFGVDNTKEEIEHLIEVLPGIVERLRAMSPLYENIKENR